MKIFASLGTSTYAFPRFFEIVTDLADDGHTVFFQNGNTSIRNLHSIKHKDFLSPEEYDHQITSADALMFHCGIGCVIDAGRVNKKCLFVPRTMILGEHCDEHQIELGKFLHHYRAASVLFPDTVDFPGFKTFVGSNENSAKNMVDAIERALQDE